MKRKWLVHAIAMAVLLAVSYGIALGLGFHWDGPLNLNARYLSDGFFVTGLVVTGVGALLWVSTTGFFDIFAYAVRSMLVTFTPFIKPENFPKFYDYKMMRMKKRGKANYSALLEGLILIALSVIMLLVYYRT
jgi:hypothetical protein